MHSFHGFKLLPLIALVCACGRTQTSDRPSAAPSAASPVLAAAPSSAAPLSSEPGGPSPLRAIVDAPDRAPDDRALDAGRHPAEMLTFFGVRPGMKVAELSAGRGYTAELLARTVGLSGVVYAQNSPFILQRYADKPWAERLSKPVMRNVVREDREFEAPLPPEANDLDAVLIVLFYHDLFWMNVDRDKANRAVFQALKSGGVYGVIDHSGRPGTGATEVKTLHRVEEGIVRKEIENAGFRFVAEADFMRNPSDARDWNDSPSAAGEKRGTSDRFVLKFQKP